MIPNRLELAKMNAMTMGRAEISLEDYLVAKQVLEAVQIW